MLPSASHRTGIKNKTTASAERRQDQYSGLTLNQDKARQRRTGLKLIHYKKSPCLEGWG